MMAGAEPFFYRAGAVGFLLVHGFTSSPFEMRGLGRYLADRGITAAAPLLAGHGTSPHDLHGTAWRDWYASVSEALDEMLAHCEQVYVAGISLGGALALYTAARRGQDLAGVVAMSTPIYLPKGLSVALKGLNRSVPFLNKLFRDIQDPIAREQHIGYKMSSVAALASLIEFLGPVRSSLPQVKVPTLVVYARHDHVVPPLSAHYIYSRLGTPDKKMLVLHKGYHIATVDYDREKLYAAICEFAGIRDQELA